jgi:hypothetical protein
MVSPGLYGQKHNHCLHVIVSALEINRAQTQLPIY